MNDIVDLNKITSGLAGMQSQTTVVQHLSNRCCEKTVTPAPENVIGLVSYYYDKTKTGGTVGWLSRKCDFENRHQGCIHEVPDYYEHYGDKYIRRFTDITNKYLTSAGKKWLRDARRFLQVYMEDGFNQNITETTVVTKSERDSNITSSISAGGIERLELSSQIFRRFAFGTHPAAYIDGGFINLTVMDMMFVSLTPDIKEWTGEGASDTFDQAIEVAKYLMRSTTLWDKAKMAYEFQHIIRNRVHEFIPFLYEAHGVNYTPARLRPILLKIFGGLFS